MNKKITKEKIYIFIIFLVIFAVFTIFLVFNMFFNNLNHVVVNSNVLDSNEYISYITKIDKALFSTALNIQNISNSNNEIPFLSNEYLSLFATRYVLENMNIYNDKIVSLPTSYNITIDDETFSSYEYISGSYLEDIVKIFFGNISFDYTNSVFYDKSSGFVCLFELYPSYVQTYNFNILQEKEIDGEYIITLEYYLDVSYSRNSFNATYVLNKVNISDKGYIIVIKDFKIQNNGS